MASASESLQIIESPSVQHRLALQIVFGHVDLPARQTLVEGMLKETSPNSMPVSGIFEARRGGRTVGAVWAQIQPGATAAVFPPGLVLEEPESTADALLKTAIEYLRRESIGVAQALLSHENVQGAMRLERAGFERLADLLYFASFVGSIDVDADSVDGDVETSLRFEPYSPDVHERLAALIRRTYEASLDCPRLGDVRKIDDVLAGYRATGDFDRHNWLIAQTDGGDLGCLLLADHPAQGQMELVYLGVVPEARGQHLGRRLVRRAQRITKRAGRARLILAVDAENHVAIDIYAASGFLQWEQRSAYLNVLSSTD